MILIGEKIYSDVILQYLFLTNLLTGNFGLQKVRFL